MPRAKKILDTKIPSEPVAQLKVGDYPIPVDMPDTTLKNAPTTTGTKRNSQRLPDPFTELPEKTRSYLRLEPYGNNILINKKEARGLLDFFRNIKEISLPDTVIKELNIHQDKLRKFLGFISIAEMEEPWKLILKEQWEPFYPGYKCKCADKKQHPKVSKSSKKEVNINEDD